MFQRLEVIELETLKSTISTSARELMQTHQFGNDQYRDEDVLDIAACAAVYEGYLTKMIRRGDLTETDTLSAIKDFAKRLDGIMINEYVRY